MASQSYCIVFKVKSARGAALAKASAALHDGGPDCQKLQRELKAELMKFLADEPSDIWCFVPKDEDSKQHGQKTVNGKRVSR